MNVEEQIRSSIERHTAAASSDNWAELQTMFAKAYRRRTIARGVLGSASIVLLAASLAVAAGISGKSKEGFVQDPNVGTFTYTTTTISEGGGTTDIMKTTGSVDVEKGIRYGSLQEKTDRGGWDTVTTEDRIYLREPSESKTEWLGAPASIQDVTLFGGEDLFGLLEDPATYLRRLRDVSTRVEATGGVTIDGVKTTGHDVTIDVDKVLAASSDDDRDFIRTALRSAKSRHVFVWTDADGIARRVKTYMEMVLGSEAGSFERTYDLGGFGEPVSIPNPEDHEVRSVPSLVEALTGVSTRCSSSAFVEVQPSGSDEPQPQPSTSMTCT